jgi:hypothetical protein
MALVVDRWWYIIYTEASIRCLPGSGWSTTLAYVPANIPEQVKAQWNPQGSARRCNNTVISGVKYYHRYGYAGVGCCNKVRRADSTLEALHFQTLLYHRVLGTVYLKCRVRFRGPGTFQSDWLSEYYWQQGIYVRTHAAHVGGPLPFASWCCVCEDWQHHACRTWAASHKSAPRGDVCLGFHNVSVACM